MAPEVTAKDANADVLSSTELRSKLDTALGEVTAAEGQLEAVLRELRSGVRAEKISVTAAVEQAFNRLRNARAELARLRELVDSA
jgi:hypothetical protein